LRKLEIKIGLLADKYSKDLEKQIIGRTEEMLTDDKSHYLIYQVLGISDKEGELIDLYQNKGRFLYKYAGSFLEDATLLCFKYKFPQARKFKVANTLGQKPKKFEIDCLVDNLAFEIKWRDATTDGDHITKEHTRVKVIQGYGYKPIRIMFYYPNRIQSMRIQETLKTIYLGVNGEYFAGDQAWSCVKSYTDVDLKGILEKIAQKKLGKEV
jgi:hypothetical protein